MRKPTKRFQRYAYVVIVIFLLELCGIFSYILELNYSTSFHYPRTEHEVGVEEDPYEINPSGQHTINDSPRLILLIKSALGNGRRREAIRRTWGKERRFSDVVIQRVFLLGKDNLSPSQYQTEISAEAQQYKDILQGSFIDAYFNNTLKTMTAMRWAIEYCNRTPYFMFVDDDYYVSIKNVLKFIDIPSSYPKSYGDVGARGSRGNETLYAGYVMQTKPHRHYFSKWHVSLQEYPFDKWPPYVTAGAFILSRKSLRDLYRASLHTPKFRFDDIYLGILALRSNVPLTNCENFHLYRLEYNGAESYQNVVASHGFGEPLEMERIWNECYSAGYA